MLLLAIDPGKHGGIAWSQDGFTSGDGTFTHCEPMPETEGDLIAILKALPEPPVVYLENLVKHMGGGIPASAMAVYASNWGFIKGAVQMAGWPLHLVTPQQWQKALGMGSRKRGTDKRAWKNHLKGECQRLFPRHNLEITLETCDALLILAYARFREKSK